MIRTFAMLLPTFLAALLLAAAAVPPRKTNASPDSFEAIVFEIHTGRILAAQSEKGLTKHRLLGSLAKPLVAYALLSAGKSSDDVFFCRPSSSEEKSTKTCWYKPGHGNLTFVEAMAVSCNAWFRQWLMDSDSAPTLNLFAKLGVLSGAEMAGVSHLNEKICGLGGDLSIPSLNCAAAFASLFNEGIILGIHTSEKGISLNAVGSLRIDTDAIKLISKAMRECGTTGTGAAFGRILGPGAALVKTGTAYAAVTGEIDESKTDGWCVALYPADKPQYLVLVHLENGSGAEAAEKAATYLKLSLENER